MKQKCLYKPRYPIRKKVFVSIYCDRRYIDTRHGVQALTLETTDIARPSSGVILQLSEMKVEDVSHT